MVTLFKNPADFAGYLPVFGGEAYLSSRSQDFGWLSDGSFVLPFYVDKRFVFRRLVITNETILLPGTRPDCEADFLEGAIGYARSYLNVDFVAKPQANAVFSVVPRNCESCEWGSYVATLEGSEEETLMRIQPRTRTAIRNAMRSGVRIETTHDVGLVFSLLKLTMQRQRQPYYPSLRFLHAIARKIPAIARFYVARCDGDVQGCAVVFFNRLGAYYYYGGSVPKPGRGSMALMHYRIMLDMKELCVPQYDFMGARLSLEEGSKIWGIQKFKSHMGTVLRKGYSFRCILRPLRYRLFLTTARLYLAAKGYEFSGDAIDDIRRVRNPVPAPGLS